MGKGSCDGQVKSNQVKYSHMNISRRKRMHRSEDPGENAINKTAFTSHARDHARHIVPAWANFELQCRDHLVVVTCNPRALARRCGASQRGTGFALFELFH
jgi:hypothetical protein